MKALQVNYKLDPAHGHDRERLVEAAHRLAELPGLQWKVWIGDAERGIGGGHYLFDTEEDAQAWADAVPAAVAQIGAYDVEVRLFDVDPELSAITLAPVAEPVR